MKLDLNKPWVLRLVRQNSTANGCSFIRGVILRTIWNALLWTVAVTFGSLLAASLIGGAYMWFDNSDYFFAGFDRLSYFGDDWIAKTWACMAFVGGLIWVLALAIGSIVGVIYLAVKGLAKSSPSISLAAGKVWDVVAPSDNFVEAVSSLYHKFCPHIEFILPTRYDGMVKGARIAVLSNDWDQDGDHAGDSWKEGLILESAINHGRMELEVLWDSTRDNVAEYFKQESIIEQYADEEALIQAHARHLKNRAEDVYLWFDQDNAHYKVVEEITSPV